MKPQPPILTPTPVNRAPPKRPFASWVIVAVMSVLFAAAIGWLLAGGRP